VKDALNVNIYLCTVDDLNIYMCTVDDLPRLCCGQWSDLQSGQVYYIHLTLALDSD
jgi:hypothetical protein